MTTTQYSRPARLADQPGVRFGLGTAGIVAALLVAAALPLDLGETASLAVMTAAAASTALPWGFAVVLGTEAWAFFTGFFENQYGVLTLESRDLLRLAGFVGATLLLARLIRVPLATARAHDREDGR